ncbi:hypothetical protein CHUAL_001715 [Chamberlinius hualienensis]
MMVEEYATHILKRLGGACANMAAAIDDLICSFELTGVSMDFGTTLLFGWVLFGVFLLLLCVFIYNRHLKPRKSAGVNEKASSDNATASPASTEKSAATSSPVSSGGRNIRSGLGNDARKGVPVNNISPAKSGFTYKPIAFKTPTINGIDKDSVDWVGRILSWMFRDPIVSVDTVDYWLKSLNHLNRSAVAEHGVNVEIQQIEQDESLPLAISNVNIEVNPKDDISLLCNAVIPQLTLIVHTSRQKGDTTLVTIYKAVITSYGGKLRVTSNPHDSVTTISLVDHPNLQIALKPISGLQGVNTLDEQALQNVLDEILSNTLSAWVLKIKFGDYRNCPQFRRELAEAPPVKPIHYDSMMATNLSPISPSAKRTKRLLTKVIKASGLGATKGCKDPYCIVEIDEPPQRHQTSFATNTDSPFWDEHFLFDLSNDSAEILFEIYDKAKPDRSAFLGLGIVSVDDLLEKPSQRQIITLQSRPYLEDPVSGSITVEFLFLDCGEIPILSNTSCFTDLPSSPANTARTATNRLVTPGGAMVTTTTTTISKSASGAEIVRSKIEIEKSPLHVISRAQEVDPEKKEEEVDDKPINEFPLDVVKNGDYVGNGVDMVTDTALRELENRQLAPLPPSTTTNKSTLIIHSVQREVVRPALKVEKTKNGKIHEVGELPEVVVVDGDKLLLDETRDRPGTADSIASSSVSSKEDLEGRSRPKERRSFVNSLRKRFSFRGSKRSKSVEHPSENNSREGSNSRSTSADRARRTNTDVPGGTTPYVPIVAPPDVGSGRSSLSEHSGISESSTQTYLNDMSTLVIETVENGLVKHYLLPASMARKSKWRKRGTKLHIFNDHIFVAKHFPGATPCQVCSKSMPRRIGKQGYECRDCQLRCHKVCHVKIDTPCPNSTANMLELSYDIYCSQGNNGVSTTNGNKTTSMGQRRPLSIVKEE